MQVTCTSTSVGSPLSKASCVIVMSSGNAAPHVGHGEKSKCFVMTGKYIEARRAA